MHGVLGYGKLFKSFSRFVRDRLEVDKNETFDCGR